MAVEILPSVLAHTPLELTKRLSTAKKISNAFHLDVMDGKFVRTRSVGRKTVGRLRKGSIAELHLMTRDPERWLPVILKLNIRRVVVHVELGRRLKSVIDVFHIHHRSVFLAINPLTSLTKLTPWIHIIQGVLVMGVHPGKYHAPWQMATAIRIQALRHRYPKMFIACDGGLDPGTITDAAAAGAERLVVGSYIQFHPRPKQAWLELRQLVGKVKK